MSDSLAKRYFDVEREWTRVESDVCAAAEAACPGFVEFTADWYDESIEVYMVGDAPVDMAALWAIGFKRAWIHRHEEVTRDCGCPCVVRPAEST